MSSPSPEPQSGSCPPDAPPTELQHPARRLRTTTVRYADRSDRCTIHPDTADRVALMSTWLSADRDAFVDLADCR